eukprot:TRINITY_DN1838_c0_g1_i1.p1 TRINITY_DN1838_c0_g1~~TRINITY_DN1838_c0_g1_i1.p1  ORF type:complete len:293 (-),score=60.54 TRINITY_DN1838_c0_g1_i1:48-926(-)
MSKDKSIEEPFIPRVYPGIVPRPPQYVQVAIAPESSIETKYYKPGSNGPFGNLSDYICGLTFGCVAPFVALLTGHSFETSRLFRLGTIEGTGNAMLMAFWILLFSWTLSNYQEINPTSASHMQVPDNMNVTETPSIQTTTANFQEAYAVNMDLLMLGAALLCMIAGIAFHMKGARTFTQFLKDYEAADLDPRDAVVVTSELGRRRDYFISALITALFPVLGSFIRLRFNSSLKSKFGIVKGFTSLLFVMSILFGGFPGIFVAIFFDQICNVHFRRAFVIAGEKVDPNKKLMV